MHIVQCMSLKPLVRAAIGDRRVRGVKALRSRLACRLDIGPWRRPGLNGLDVRLADAIGRPRDCTFIELGGNDGLQQSNSFMLERELGWRGVLIEAIPQLAAEAVRNRPKATVVCAAVAGPGGEGLARMSDQDLISAMSDSGGNWVATTTLSQIVDTVLNGHAPHLLSIDVEGFECEVLSGLDLTRHSPQWILVETNKPDVVGSLLPNFALEGKLSHHDYLFRLLN